VLVVDDDEGLLHLMKLVLRRAGLEAIMASSGSEALDLFTEQQPDLAIIDVAMPGMDGFQLVEEITRRRCGAERGIPIVMLSAHGREDLVQRGYDLGIDLYLVKPVPPRDIIGCVTSLLEG
jgi:DNA-binding response OmpR family regulator